MASQDVRSWRRWLSATRLEVRLPPPASTGCSRPQHDCHGKGVQRRCIRPTLSHINLHVLSLLLLDTADILLHTDGNTSNVPEKRAMSAPSCTVANNSSLSTQRLPSSHFNSLSTTPRKDDRPGRRLFASSFRSFSDRSVHTERVCRINRGRRAHPESGRICVRNLDGIETRTLADERVQYLAALTLHSIVTFHLVQPTRRRLPTYLRGPSLTKMTQQDWYDQTDGEQQGQDNRDHFHIFYRYDIIPNQDTRYLVLAALGAGAYGQVLKCQDMTTRDLVAIKVVKHHSRSYRASYQKEKDLLKVVSNVQHCVQGIVLAI